MTGAPAALLWLGLVVVPGLAFVRRGAPSCPLMAALALAHLTGAAALAVGITAGFALTLEVNRLWGLAGLAALGALGWPKLRRPRTLQARGLRLSPIDAALAALVVLGVLTVVLRALLLPLEIDGWAIWHFKAKAIADGSLAAQLASPHYAYAHPDYPLLLPAHTWWLSGDHVGTKLAQCTGLLFLLDLLALVYTGIRQGSNRTLALVGCAAVLSWGFAVRHAASGFADVPLAAYSYSTILVSALGRPHLAAMLLAGALLTKNEGVFTLVAVMIVALTRPPAAPSQGPSSWARRRLAAGLALSVALVALGSWNIAKNRLGVTGDMLTTANLKTLRLETAGLRIPVIAEGFERRLLAFGPDDPAWGFLWLVAAMGLVVSVALPARSTYPYWVLAFAHLCGALLAYLVTPADLQWHIRTSLDRLLLHAAPATLTATVLALCQALGREASPPFAPG